MRGVCRNQLPFDGKPQHTFQDIQLLHDRTRRNLTAPMCDVLLHIHAANLCKFHSAEEWPKMGFDDPAFARVRIGLQ
jgi:hypothetical protein